MHLTEGGVVAPAALEMAGISKHFEHVRALDKVDLAVRANEVMALLGENGAGKSTLLKILGGSIKPDSGRLLLGGVPVSFGSPREARDAGVRVIQQEPEIIPHVSVAENVYVGGGASGRGPVFHRRQLLERVQADIERCGFAGVLRPDTLGVDLSPAQRQLVEIIRSLVANVSVLALDEPTASLSSHEVDALFALIERLRDEGVAVIYVSHRMKEIFRIADRVSVLRDGRNVGVRSAKTSEGELVGMMVGRDLAAFVRDRRDPGEVMLSVRNVTTDDVENVSFEVRAGEVVALAGLVGAGRSELARALVGDRPLRSGTVLLAGRPLRLRTPRDAVRAGIGLAPEDRRADALLLERSVRDNVSLAILSRLCRLRVVNRGKERRVVEEYVRRLRVRTPSLDHSVNKLSGGNQQKTVVARWLARNPKLLILDEPTRGIDVGAKAEIYAIVDQLAAEGMAILVISSELPEVLGLADRIVVMQGGQVTGELDRDEATEERVLTLAVKRHLSSEPKERHVQ